MRKKIQQQPKIQNAIFEIPQMATNFVKLKSARHDFLRTKFVSAVHGSSVKDVISIPRISHEQENIVKTYEPFRINKRISREDTLRETGKYYPEFHGIEESSDTPKAKVKEQVAVEPATLGLDLNCVLKLAKPAETPAVVKSVHKEQPKVHSFEGYKEEPKVFFHTGEDLNSLPPFVSNKSNLPPISPVEDSEYEETFEIKTKIEYRDQTPKREPLNWRTEPTEVAQREKPGVQKTFLNPSNEQTHKEKDYRLPPLTLLSRVQQDYDRNPEFIKRYEEIINTTLQDFGIDGYVENHTFGPTVTRYEIKLQSGINVKKILTIEGNLAMNLSAKSIRIEAPIPGKPTVGIEVPNLKPRLVKFGEIVSEAEFADSSKPLTIALGLDIDGKAKFADITNMPHLLVGGATASGKSVCVNTILVSLLLKNHPDDLKMILIDPKYVELIVYDGLPHLITPVISDAKMASQALRWVVDEMDRRYRMFATTRSRDIVSYNDKQVKENKIPYIVIVIDELADLMFTCSQDVEESIQRITQKARAAGIHLIIATQRPTTDVVKGTIKANIPSRIAFRVASFIDSNTILDGGGAESLLGRGDMLFKETDLAVRLQGAYLTMEEIDAVIAFINEQRAANYSFTHDDLASDQSNGLNNQQQESPEMLYNAAMLFIEKGACSINALQTNFNIGFNRAQRIVELLEQLNIVSEKRGTVGREILINRRQLDDIFDK